MARVNITVPDEVVGAAKASGLNISALATGALRRELDRRSKLAAVDLYLAQAERQIGPIPESEAVAARAWADAIVPSTHSRPVGAVGA